ncbi:hypothetical protein K1719_031977 [Acacia pycnantha]|nr:hypothetical protein K1719_039176 [Acacia pycnantha]KAI9085900.1 hypothetical protein K1719_031977 [Acacia pycnantha]
MTDPAEAEMLFYHASRSHGIPRSQIHSPLPLIFSRERKDSQEATLPWNLNSTIFGKEKEPSIRTVKLVRSTFIPWESSKFSLIIR